MAELFDEIFNSIHLITDRKINELQKNITIISTISEHVDVSKNLYKISYQGIEYDAYSSTNELYSIGDSVLVLIPNGNYSNKKIILMKEPKIAEDIALGGGGHDLPPGGNAGQVLTKVDNIDYNVEWTDITTLNATATQSHIYVKNGAGVALTKGQAVYINGSDGTNITIGLAQANSEGTSSKTLGLLEQDLANNQHGYVVTEGLLAGIDTSSATIGDPVWLSPTTSGSLIFGLANKPTSPAHLVYLGVVSRVNANNGEIFVHVQNGFEIDELHNVSISAKANKDIISYDSSSGLWKNKTFVDLDIPTKTYVDSNKVSKSGDTINGNLDIEGTIQHNGLNPSTGTNIDQIYTVTDSLTLTTAWQDTSVNSSELATGTYIVQISSVNDNAVGGGHWTEYYSGIMSWFSGDTNATTTDEIILHRAGHAPNTGIIYLRIKRTPTADVNNLILQIAGNTNNTGASNYTFKFRRMI